MTPQRIQLRRTKGWRKPEGAIVVSRPSRWGNPFLASVIGNAEAVRIYRECLTTRVGTMPAVRGDQVYSYPAERYALPTVDDVREALAGRDLACWCPPDQPCHADVLLELANGDR